jgi:hypothetical protein
MQHGRTFRKAVCGSSCNGIIVEAISVKSNSSKSMAQGPFSGSDSRPAGQEILLSFMEPKFSLPCSQEPATDPNLEPLKSNTCNLF